nr:MAG TPA: hypothetical protein [Caudoviricetes sp.]
MSSSSTTGRKSGRCWTLVKFRMGRYSPFSAGSISTWQSKWLPVWECL